MDNSEPRPSISSAVCYKDPKRALRWLEEAFGFEPFIVILGANDELMHSEMRFGNGTIMVGSEWSPMHKSPANVNGLNTQTVHVQLSEDVGTHCTYLSRSRFRRAHLELRPDRTAHDFRRVGGENSGHQDQDAPLRTTPH